MKDRVSRFRRWAVISSIAGMMMSCTACTDIAPPLAKTSTAQLVFDGLNAAILSVSGTASDDIYAVGADPGDGLGPYVLHYDGYTWRRLETGTTGDLWWISVHTIDGAFYMAGEGGRVIQFTPATGRFEEHVVSGEATLFGVWGQSRDDLWTVGGDLDDPDLGGVIAHFDGQAWTSFDLSAIAAEGLPTLYKVWGRGPSDVYAVGRLGFVMHFDGVSWTRLANDTQRTLFTIHGNDSTVVATGGAGDAVIEELRAGKFVNQAPDDIIQMNGVFIPAHTQGVTVGNQASVAFRTDAGWELQDIGIETTLDLHAVWMDPNGGIWAVGGHLGASLDQGIVVYIGDDVISNRVNSG